MARRLTPLVHVLFPAGALSLAIACSGSSSSSSVETPDDDPPGVTDPGIEFKRVDALRGIQPFPAITGMAIGAAAADYDDDGDVDLFVPRGQEPDHLYRNRGTGRFDEIGEAAGVDDARGNRVGLLFDYDGDGALDLFTATDDPSHASSYAMKRQQGQDLFVDVTELVGLHVYTIAEEITHQGGVCAGDIDNDGYLELYTGMWRGRPRLYLNDTGTGFLDISVSSGIAKPHPDAVSKQWQPMMADLDGDGWQDIYVAVDFTENFLWINQRDHTFVDVAEACGADLLMNDMGMSIVDYDDDGDLDLYTTNVYATEKPLRHNAMLRNDTSGGPLEFSDVSRSIGLAQGAWGWGVTAMDADRDGLVDFAATNGFRSPVPGLEGSVPDDRSRFWLQNAHQPGTFREVGQEVKFADLFWGSNLISFDYDRDGDLDLLQSTMDEKLRLMDNRPIPGSAAEGHHYLVVAPRTLGPNKRAIGAVVRVTANGRRMTRLISAGTSCLGQEPAEAFFGLGEATVADRLEIEYPDGQRLTYFDVPGDQRIELWP